MRYYVVSDVHGFYTELISAIRDKGFFKDKEPHKLVICGDLFDRGQKAEQLQSFILDLMERQEVILIKGNHEDLALELVDNVTQYLCGFMRAINSHHFRNQTIDTLCRLTGMSFSEAIDNNAKFVSECRKTPYFSKIIPAMIDYYETKNYIFVHGWIPCIDKCNSYGEEEKSYMKNWRDADTIEWEKARWLNGMDCACKYNVLEPGKTIVCGHYHASYGHFYYGEAESEFGSGEDFSPFYSNGIIAIDACTAYSAEMNCIVIDD